jgi:hypothetical protein
MAIRWQVSTLGSFLDQVRNLETSAIGLVIGA